MSDVVCEAEGAGRGGGRVGGPFSSDENGLWPRGGCNLLYDLLVHVVDARGGVTIGPVSGSSIVISWPLYAYGRKGERRGETEIEGGRGRQGLCILGQLANAENMLMCISQERKVNRAAMRFGRYLFLFLGLLLAALMHFLTDRSLYHRRECY